jgi:fucose 4-O-acetylase-like acetyltransferase
MNHKRNDTLDIAKGIGMVCIIAGHMGISPITHLVFVFHVPLFFIISGYFLRMDNSVDFLKKKSRQLIKPYIITSVLICLFDLAFRSAAKIILGIQFSAADIAKRWALSMLYGSGTRTDFFNLQIPSIGTLWFLLALLWALLITNYIGSKKHGIIWIILIAVAGILTSRYTWLMWSVQAGAVAAVFILLGWYARQKEWNTLIVNRPIVNTVSFVLLCFSIFLSYYKGEGVMALVQCRFPRGIIDFIGAVNGSVLVLNISKWISEHSDKIKKLLCIMGKYSLIVLCAHSIELNAFPWGTIEGMIGENMVIKCLYFIFAFLAKIIWALLCIKTVTTFNHRGK